MRPLADIANELAATSTVLQRIVVELRETAPEPPASYVLVPRGDSIQAAIDRSPAGTEIRLEKGGVYPGNLVIRKPIALKTHDCDELGSRRVTPADTQLAKLVPTTSASLIDVAPGTTSVSLARLACDTGNLNDVIVIGHADSSQTTALQQPTGIALSQLLMQAQSTQTPKRGIGLHGHDVSIVGCHIAGIKRVGQDAQAIAGWNGQGWYTIRDCYLEAAGETVMFGGADPTIPGLVPADIELIDCTLTKDLAWRGTGYTVKNIFELKAGKRVTLRNCQLSNCWLAGQGGFGVMLTPQSQGGTLANVEVSEVLFDRCEITNVSSGVTVMGLAQIGTSLQTHSIAFRDCWIKTNRTQNAGQGWPFFVTRGPRGITIEHCTVETDGNQIVFQDGPPVEGFAMTGNLMPRSHEYGFTVNGGQHRGVGLATAFPGGVITGNAIGRLFPTPEEPYSSGINPTYFPNNLIRDTRGFTLTDGYGTGEYAAYGRRRT